MPLLPPSKAKNATFHRGANFAITGATSLDTPFFVERGLGKTVWNSGSLHTQIQWFQDMKPKLCSSPDECRDLFRRSLFIVGEFGGNDYNSPLFAFRPISEAHDFVPHVVESIGSGVEKLIAEGAVELVVPGVLPIGCFPVYLSIFRKQADGYGGRSGCIRDLNTLSWVHNAALRRKVEELRGRYPDVRIVYADYYTPAIQFVLHAEKYGESISPCILLRCSFIPVAVDLLLIDVVFSGGLRWWLRLWSRQFASKVVAASEFGSSVRYGNVDGR